MTHIDIPVYTCIMKYISNHLIYTAIVIMLAVIGYNPPETQAVPAYPGPIVYTQPDGSLITLYRSGDENHKEIRDAQGCLMYIAEDGWARPIDRTQLALMRSAEENGKKFLFNGAAFPAEGSPRALVILVEFSDRTFSMSDPHDYYDRLLNEEGFSDYGATGSCRDFFVENSHGRFTPHFDVYGPVQLSKIMKYYGANTLYGNDIRPYEAVIEGVKLLDDEIDYSDYDLNDDGLIDNVFVFYAGYGEADSYVYNSIWPHSADLDEFNLGKEYYFDGKRLNRYGMSNEIDYTYRRPDGIGTFVHEFSHVMGLPDLYCTDYTGCFTPGGYCTLDLGSYNNQGRTPPHYSIFERYSLGWIDPVKVESPGTCVLDPIHISNSGLIIPTERENEFFLIENRQQECCDEFIPGHGMLVWHIDFDQKKWDDNGVNNDASHQYVDLVEADNRRTESTRDGDTFPGRNGITELSQYTTPAFKSWSGEPVGYSLSDIEETGNKLKFTISCDTSGIDSSVINDEGLSDVTDPENVAIYNFAGVIVGRGISDLTHLPGGIYIMNGKKIVLP